MKIVSRIYRNKLAAHEVKDLKNDKRNILYRYVVLDKRQVNNQFSIAHIQNSKVSNVKFVNVRPFTKFAN